MQPATTEGGHRLRLVLLRRTRLCSCHDGSEYHLCSGRVDNMAGDIRDDQDKR